MVYLVLNDRSPISHAMNLKYMTASSHMSNIAGLNLSRHKITYGIKILINAVSAAEDIILDSFHCHQLHLETLVVSEQWVCAITYEINR